VKLHELRKQLPSRPAPKPITPSLDRLWGLIEQANTPPPHPRQKFITAGLEDESGNPLDWTHWRKE